MDILRAVTESLVHLEVNSAFVTVPDASVYTVSSTCFQTDAEEAQVGAGRECTLQGVAGHGLCVDGQVAGIRRAHESGRTGQKGCPGAPFPVPRGRDQEGQRRVKDAVFFR